MYRSALKSYYVNMKVYMIKYKKQIKIEIDCDLPKNQFVLRRLVIVLQIRNVFHYLC